MLIISSCTFTIIFMGWNLPWIYDKQDKIEMIDEFFLLLMLICML